jgi:putative flavoprotein involved in K+ transport
VVLATGPYQRPAVPAISGEVSDAIFQVHSSAYRNPGQLPPGGVLVVGAGASGAQIAEELLLAGRRVHLSVGAHRRLPRRYRGRDVIWWLSELGMDETTVETRPPDHSPLVISGAGGGHTIDFRRFCADGMVLLGRALSAQNGGMSFAPDLAASLSHGDEAYTGFLAAADRHVRHAGLDLPEDFSARDALPDPPELAEPILALDLAARGISAIVWATGYGYDLGWVELPVLDAAGRPRHRRGVTEVEGIYFLGLQWLHKAKSAFLSCVGEDAAYLAERIAARS